MPYDVTGQPAMSVPLHWNAEGVPIGAMLAVPLCDDAALFRLAAQPEQAQPWANQGPPLRG